MIKVLINISIIFIVLAIGAFLVNKKTMAEAAVNTYEISIDLKENNTAKVELKLNIQNNVAEELVTGKTFTLPFNDLGGLTATLNDEPIDFSVDNNNKANLSNVKTNFQANAIRPGQSSTLKLNFEVKKAVNEYEGLKQFLFYTNSFNAKDQGNIIIIYPNSFGEVSFSTASQSNVTNLENNRIKLEFSNLSSILLLWGDKYSVDIQSKFYIVAENNPSQFYLVNLPESNSSQSIDYKTFFNAEYGLYDNLDNHFALVNILDNKDIGFEARLTKTLSLLQVDDFPQYDFTLDENSDFGSLLLNEISLAEFPLDKFKRVNDFLVNNTKSLESNKTYLTKSNIENVWVADLNEKEFSSLEYCYIFTSLANYLGHQSKIKYGYVLVPNSQTVRPHVWCELNIEETVFLVDTYTEKATGLSYFGLSNDFDRISFGTWDPNLSHINLLGLVSDSDFYQNINIIEAGNFEVNMNNTVSLNITAPQNVYSGLKFKLTMIFNNMTTKFIPIADVKVNSKSKMEKIKFNDHLYPALLPNQTNLIDIKDLQDYNILKKGEKQFEVDVNLDNEANKNLVAFSSSNYNVDDKLLLATLGISIFSAIVFMALLIKTYNKRSHN